MPSYVHDDDPRLHLPLAGMMVRLIVPGEHTRSHRPRCPPRGQGYAGPSRPGAAGGLRTAAVQPSGPDDQFDSGVRFWPWGAQGYFRSGPVAHKHRSNVLAGHRATTFLAVGAARAARFWPRVPQGRLVLRAVPWARWGLRGFRRDKSASQKALSRTSRRNPRAPLRVRGASGAYTQGDPGASSATSAAASASRSGAGTASASASDGAASMGSSCGAASGVSSPSASPRGASAGSASA